MKILFDKKIQIEVFFFENFFFEKITNLYYIILL